MCSCQRKEDTKHHAKSHQSVAHTRYVNPYLDTKPPLEAGSRGCLLPVENRYFFTSDTHISFETRFGSYRPSHAHIRCSTCTAECQICSLMDPQTRPISGFGSIPRRGLWKPAPAWLVRRCAVVCPPCHREPACTRCRNQKEEDQPLEESISPVYSSRFRWSRTEAYPSPTQQAGKIVWTPGLQTAPFNQADSLRIQWRNSGIPKTRNLSTQARHQTLRIEIE